MNLSDFNYCYLNNIYRTKDVVAFELALADKLFKHCAIYLVDSEHLIEIEKMDDLIKDFKIVDGLLKCTTVKIVPAFNGIESEINKLTEIKQDTGSFYALAKEGANNNYVIIDEKQIDINGDQDNLIGPGLAKFLDISDTMFIDEAFGAASADNTQKMGPIIQNIAENGIQVILVSQNSSLYENIPHREIYFHKDSITQSVVIDSITDY